MGPLEKNPKSFHSDYEGVSEFKSDRYEGAAPPLESFGPLAEPVEFQFPDEFISQLEREPSVKALWEQRVEAEVERRMVSKSAIWQSEAEKKGMELGLNQGMADARGSIEGAIRALNGLAEQIMNQKEALLHNHENKWIDSIRHLMHRFCIEKKQALGESMEAWIKQSVQSFSKMECIKVFVSDEQYLKIKGVLEAGGLEKVTVVSDSMLRGSDVRCEVGDGGLFFSNEDALATLDEIAFGSERSA